MPAIRCKPERSPTWTSTTVRQVFDVRVFGAIAAVKHAAPYLRPGGSVVLTSGVASQRPHKGWVALASVCSAMEILTRALAVELAPSRVNLVSPGQHDTGSAGPAAWP
ncbi:SDR family oxidoreductase [Paraburkholderia sediminicola]|uniref:SDR family oxidoreductase n=1 Tax=Paraburkholderia sediminicola TaxID=458836 RepID=UPI0038BA3304